MSPDVHCDKPSQRGAPLLKITSLENNSLKLQKKAQNSISLSVFKQIFVLCQEYIYVIYPIDSFPAFLNNRSFPDFQKHSNEDQTYIEKKWPNHFFWVFLKKVIFLRTCVASHRDIFTPQVSKIFLCREKVCPYIIKQQLLAKSQNTIYYLVV